MREFGNIFVRLREGTWGEGGVLYLDVHQCSMHWEVGFWGDDLITVLGICPSGEKVTED